MVEIDRAGHARYFTTMQMLLATLQLGGSGATMPPPGSEIARAGGKIVGAIGVSGVQSNQDAQIAQAGADAVKA